jgi:hypothetical protein
MESGITYGGVTSLAVSLDIKNDQTFLRRWSVQPSCLAMMVVKKWLDMKDPTLEEAHQELEKQLRFLDLSKAIPKLQGRRNPSETGKCYKKTVKNNTHVIIIIIKVN